MSKQAGFISVDVTSFILILFSIGVVAGMLILWLVQTVWPYAKLFIHQITG